LTQLGGGEVAIDPRSGATLIPYFTVTVLLDEGITASLRHGLTGWVRLVSIEESLGLILFRKFLRFTNRLR
jgi:hypothetical protein